MSQVRTAADLSRIKEAYLAQQSKYAWQILVCGGAGCVSSHC